MGMFDELKVHYVCECSFDGLVYSQTKTLSCSMEYLFPGKYIGFPKNTIVSDVDICPECKKEFTFYIAVSNGYVVYIGTDENKAISKKLLWRDADIQILASLNREYDEIVENYRQIRHSIHDFVAYLRDSKFRFSDKDWMDGKEFYKDGVIKALETILSMDDDI